MNATRRPGPPQYKRKKGASGMPKGATDRTASVEFPAATQRQDPPVDVWIATGRLVQRSTLSTGSHAPGEQGAGEVDMPFELDGLGRPTLRGRSLAGAFFATLRRCGLTPPRSFTRGQMLWEDDTSDDSVVGVWTSHPEGLWHTEESSRPVWRSTQLRAGNGVRQDLGVVEEDFLYDAEVLPPGTCWPLVMALDLQSFRELCNPTEAECDSLLDQFELGLREWSSVRQRCWLGRGVARGLGWVHLEGCQLHPLRGLDAMTWADDALFDGTITNRPRRNFAGFVAWLGQAAKSGSRALRSRLPTDDRPVASGAWHLARLKGEIVVGEPRAADRPGKNWGLDTLSVGGHDAFGLPPAKELRQQGHLVAPCSAKPDRYADAFAPDSGLAVTRGADGTVQPYVPGSGIRGPLRAAVSARLRGKDGRGEAVADPVASRAGGASLVRDKPDEVEKLFGSANLGMTFNSSLVLVKDALLSTSSLGTWQCALIEMHAEDELMRGVFGGSKFDRLALMKAVFEFEIVVEARSRQAAIADAEQLRRVLLAGRSGTGHGLVLGGATRRGHGGVLWRVTAVEDAPYGGDWSATAHPKGSA